MLWTLSTDVNVTNILGRVLVHPQATMRGDEQLTWFAMSVSIDESSDMLAETLRWSPRRSEIERKPGRDIGRIDRWQDLREDRHT